MTKQMARLEAQILAAEDTLQAAIRWANTTDPYAPIKVKIADQARITRAYQRLAELEDRRSLLEA